MLISAEITKTYDTKTILSNFKLEIEENEIVALLGASGSGKSTIAKILVGVEEPDPVSSIEVKTGLGIAYAQQEPELAVWRTVSENLLLEQELIDPKTQFSERKLQDVLSLVELEDQPDYFPDQLSVGMRQRVQLARTLFRDAPLAIFDEPLSAVDEIRREKIAIRIRASLKKHKNSALWITHDIAEAVQIADRVVVLDPSAQSEKSQIVIEEKDRSEVREKSSVAERHLRDLLMSKSIADKNTNSITIPSESQQQNKPGYWSKFFPVFAVFLGLVGIWQMIAITSAGGNFFISSPTAVAITFANEVTNFDFWSNVGWTTAEAGLGLFFGLVVGISVGLLSAASPFLSSGIRPYLVGATAVPLFILAPAFIIWFGVGFNMKVAIAALSSFPIIALGMIEPFEAETEEFSKHMLQQRVSRWRLFIVYLLPKGILGFLMVMRPAAIAALIGAFLGEFIAAEAGLGYYILLNASRYNIEEVLVGSMFLFAMAIGFQVLMSILVKKRLQIVRAIGL